MGLNGLDNGRMIFRNFAIPSSSLLDKASKITNNSFVSKVANRRDRFLYAVNKLISGRLCIAGAALSGSKLCLLITTKYANDRLSTGQNGKSNTPISQYQLFQLQILPLIAKVIVLNVGYLYITCCNKMNVIKKL